MSEQIRHLQERSRRQTVSSHKIMNNVPKFMFYYEPGSKNPYTRSYTLSFSRIDEESNTYKQKAILQHWSDKRGNLEEYKLKEVHIGRIKNISQQWQSLEKMSKEVMNAIIKRANY